MYDKEFDELENEVENENELQKYTCIYSDNGICSNPTKRPKPISVSLSKCSKCEERVSPETNQTP